MTKTPGSKILSALAIAGLCSLSVGAHADSVRCVFDVDGNGEVDALTDGLLIARVTHGIRGAALVRDVLGPGATRVDPDAIVEYIIDNRQALDIDGDGYLDAPTDAQMLIRHMFGLSGDDVVKGAVWDSSPRKTWGAVRGFLENGC